MFIVSNETVYSNRSRHAKQFNGRVRQTRAIFNCPSASCFKTRVKIVFARNRFEDKEEAEEDSREEEEEENKEKSKKQNQIIYISQVSRDNLVSYGRNLYIETIN